MSIFKSKIYGPNKKKSETSSYQDKTSDIASQPLKSIFNKRKATSLSPVKINSNNSIFNSLSHKQKTKEKTLFIDLDETLVHSTFQPIDNPDIFLQVILENDTHTTDIYVSVRPGTKQFIKELSNYYEIVPFTASSSNYAEPLIKILDVHKVIEHKLYRDNCTFQNGVYIKDLSKIGKDLRKIVLIDNNIMSYSLQSENGIPIKSWYDDYADFELFKLIPILKNLSGFYDVRTEISKFVYNNTFVWMKGINWLKENLLNITYMNDVEQVMQLEKKYFELKKFKTDVNVNVNLLGKDNFNKGRNGLYKHMETNDFIKITNNFFYDVSPQTNNIKIENNEEVYQYQPMLTEVDNKEKYNKIKKISLMHKSSSMKKKKFIHTIKERKGKSVNRRIKEKGIEILGKNEKKKNSNRNSLSINSLHEIFQQITLKKIVKVKGKGNQTVNCVNTDIGGMMNEQKSNINKKISLTKGKLIKKNVHHFQSYSINLFSLQKNSKMKKRKMLSLLNSTK